MRTRRGFTLIELLTVMVMSAILLALIIIPLFQSFNLTRAAQAFAEAQDRARILTERISKEVGNAYSVRSGAVFTTNVNGVNRKVSASTTVISLPRQGGGINEIVLPGTKLDLIRPAEGDQTQIMGGAFTNTEGRVDPTLQSPRGQVVVPVAPGFGMVRYFIARRDPFADYNNPYDGTIMTRNAQRDNLYVLYRAEIQPLIRRAGTGSNGDNTDQWRPNTLYFASDAATDRIVSDIDDPRFMEPDRDGAGLILTTGAKADRIRNWLRRAVVQTEVSRYDMIQPVIDLRTRIPQQDPVGSGIPKIVPLVQFRPERIANDPATGHLAVREGEESASSDSAGPDVYTTQYGHWSSFVVRTYPRGWRADTDADNNYLVGLSSVRSGDAGYAPGFSVYGYDPNVYANDFDIENLRQAELFDVTTYQYLLGQKSGTISDRVYPFSSAVASANLRSGWLTSGNWHNIFLPYNIDPSRGRVVSSFRIDEVGNPASTPTVLNNLPYAPTSLPGAAGDPLPPYTPATDPKTGGVFSDPQYQSINDLFNKVYRDYPSLLPGRVHRFIDLRVTPNSDGTASPLFPNRVAGLCTGFTLNTDDGGNRNRVQIVPGSEVVYGPDQLPGRHYGQSIRYSRVTSGEPGPNQYKINYADLQEPTNGSGAIDYSVTFDGISTAGFNPRVYDPNNFVSRVLQPRYKVGYIQLNSDPNIPLPYTSGSTDPAEVGFRISYRFQFTGTQSTGRTKTDSFAVDYDSRDLIEVLLTIRNYPQSSLPNPQTVTLKASAKVRNFSR